MKLELEDLGSLENQTSAIRVLNENFGRIEDAFENTFSRDGLTPNYLDAPVDVNSQRLMNLAPPSSGSDAARLVDVSNALALDGLVSVPSFSGNSDRLLGTDGSILVWKLPTDYPGLGDLKASNNLSEINPTAARTNLGLGSSATYNVGTSGSVVPVLNASNTWAEAQILTGGMTLSGSTDYRNSSISTTLSADSIGYRGVPTLTQDSSYTFVMNDAGQSKLHTSGTAHTYTLPSNASVAFPLGTIIVVANIGSGVVTIARGSGVELRQATVGTDKNMAVAQWGLCTLYKYGTNSWLASGPGVS